MNTSSGRNVKSFSGSALQPWNSSARSTKKNGRSALRWMVFVPETVTLIISNGSERMRRHHGAQLDALQDSFDFVISCLYLFYCSTNLILNYLRAINRPILCHSTLKYFQYSCGFVPCLERFLIPHLNSRLNWWSNKSTSGKPAADSRRLKSDWKKQLAFLRFAR